MGTNIMSKNGGVIGVSDHGGWAVLVTVARDGTLLDRRRVELVGEGLPKIPHHSEGQGLPLDEAVELVGACACRQRGMRCLPWTLLRGPCRVSWASPFASARSFHPRLPSESGTTVRKTSPTG